MTVPPTIDTGGCGIDGCCWSGWNGYAKTKGMDAAAAGAPVAVVAAAGAEAVADPAAGLALGGAAVLGAEGTTGPVCGDMTYSSCTCGWVGVQVRVHVGMHAGGWCAHPWKH
jgi:hypothetical protein